MVNIMYSFVLNDVDIILELYLSNMKINSDDMQN